MHCLQHNFKYQINVLSLKNDILKEVDESSLPQPFMPSSKNHTYKQYYDQRSIINIFKDPKRWTNFQKVVQRERPEQSLQRVS